MTSVIRLILNVALWMTKFAFLTSLLATSYCLTFRPRLVLYGVGLSLVATLGVVIWAIASNANFSEPYYTPQEIVDTQMWLGAGYTFFDADVESLLTAMNIFTDVALTAAACYIIRSMRASGGTPTFLIVLLAINLVWAVARLALIIEYDKTSITVATVDKTSIAVNNNLSIAVVVFSEFEVLLNAIVACMPGFRVWTRHWTASSDGTATTSWTSSSGLETESQKGDFVGEPHSPSGNF